MAQDNDSDMSTTFSTLNVNAMEFVPSFVVQDRPEETGTTAPPPAPTEDPVPPAATASPAKTPTKEVIEDKSPENPGKKKSFNGVRTKEW